MHDMQTYARWLRHTARTWIGALALAALPLPANPGHGAPALTAPANAGFEEGLRGWRRDRLPGVSGGDVTLVADGAPEGDQYVRLTGTADRPVVGITCDPVPAPKGGAHVRLSFLYRTVGDPVEVVARVRPLDARGQRLTPTEAYPPASLPLLASGVWREASRACWLVPEAAAYDVSFWVRGPGSLCVDRVAVRALRPEEIGVPAQGARIRGAHQDAVQVWYESPLKRVYRDTPAPSRETDAVDLSAARGECEAFQIVLVPRAHAARVRVRWQDFLGPGILPRELGRSAWVDYVQVTRSTAPFGRTGLVPDILDPEDARDLPGGQVQPIWLTLQVPRDARPGLYQGAVHIESRPRDQWAAPSLSTLRIPVRLRVHRFALPEDPALTTLARVQQVPPEGRGWVQRNLRAHRVTGEAYAGPLAAAISPTGEATLPFAEFDAGVTECLSAGLRLFEVPGALPGGDPPVPAPEAWPLAGLPRSPVQSTGEPAAALSWNGVPLSSPEFAKTFTSYLQQVAAHLREREWLQHAVVRLWGGPVDDTTRDTVRRLSELARAAAPDLRLLIEAPFEAGMEGCADIWCVPFPLGIRASLTRVPPRVAVWARDDRLYGIDADAAALEMRAFPWRLKRLGMTGVVWPAITHWPPAPDAATQAAAPPADEAPAEPEDRLAPGDPPPGWGILIYPGRKDGPPLRDSIRWELFREGVEDYDALTLLEAAYTAACTRLQVRDGRFRPAGIVARLTGAVAPSPVEATNDPARLHAARALVNDLIEFLSGDPPCVFCLEDDGGEVVWHGVTLPAAHVWSGPARVAVDAGGHFRVPVPRGRLVIRVQSGAETKELAADGGLLRAVLP